MPLVVLEGSDYSGKTTIMERLSKALSEDFPSTEVILTRQPGGCSEISAIREAVLSKSLTPTTQLAMFMADRLYQIETQVLPALSDNKLVICDRWLESSLIYQEGADEKLVEEQIRLVRSICPVDHYIFLRATPHQIVTRRAERTKEDILDAVPESEYMRRVSKYDQMSASLARMGASTLVIPSTDISDMVDQIISSFISLKYI